MKPGDTIGDRFEIQRPAASGAMGAVFQAKDLRSGASVALKVLRFGGTSAAEPRRVQHLDADAHAERFVREARVLAELEHPAIVRYVAHGVTKDEQPYLAMEWLEGIDLAKRLEEGRLAVADGVTVARRIAEALAFAHARGIVHRDIKPGNVFLPGGRFDLATVLDFGIARKRGLLTLTQADVVLGTPSYMAPEQARGGGSVDARADVYALGSVLFKCLTGEAPFSGGDVIALLGRVVFEQARRPSAVRRDVPPALDDLVLAMLSKDPALRPHDGAELLGHLTRVAESLGTVPRPPTSAERLLGAEQRLVSVILVSPGSALEEDEARRLGVVVAPYGGRLESLTNGAVVVALSGASGQTSATDQAANAARCALAMRDAVPGWPVALATGRGVALAKLPVGDALDRAAQLLRTVAPHPRREGELPGVRIDEVTAGLLVGGLEVVTTPSGLELIGEARSFETPRTLLGVATPCVGRAHELSALRAAFDACVRDSSARYFLVTGAAGVGKSRLRIEFLRELRRTRAPTQIWMGRGDPRRMGSPFGLLTEALRVAFALHEGEPLLLRQEKLRARLGQVLRPAEVSRVTDFLGHLVGVPPAGEPDAALEAARSDPVLMGDQMRRAAEDFLAAACGDAPVVLVLENLHAGDLSTVQFVDAMLRNLRHLPLIVLAFGRPEVRQSFPKLWAERRGVALALGELPRSACRTLVVGALDGAPREVVERLVQRSGGNAFYLEELVRSAAEGKGNALPATLVAMVQARIGRLDAGPRRVLRAASVFGRAFWQRAVEALGEPEDSALLPRRLDALVEQEFLVRRPESKLAGEKELVFRDELVEEAAYSTLTAEDRTLGHRLAGEWLERAGESDPVVLATHFERGGVPARAASWYARAAEILIEGNDFAAAVAMAERGLSCGVEGAARAALRLVQAEAHHWRGDAALTESAALEALCNLPRGEGPWCTALGYVASASSKAGEDEGLVEHAELVHELLREGKRHPALFVAASRVVAALVFAGRYDVAKRLLGRVRAAGEAVLGSHPAVAARVEYAQALCAAVLGDLSTHLELSAQAAARFESIGDLRNACFQLVAVGNGFKELGASARAETALTSALASADRMGLLAVGATARANLAVVLARQGALARAQAEALIAVEAFAALGDVRMLGGARAYLATVLTLAGDLAGAEREARLSLEELAGHAPTRCLALGVYAQVRLEQGAVADALAASAEAVALVDALGGVEEGEATARLVHARSLRAAGKADAANHSIQVAAERIEERSRRIRDAELRETFLHGVPEHEATLKLATALRERS